MICLLNGEEVDIPDDLVESETIFRNVINLEVFTSLSDEEKTHLKTFLPKEQTTEQTDETIRLLFNQDEKFTHGNPVQVCYEKIKNGLLSSKVVEMQMKCKKLKMKNYKLMQKQYFKNLLQEIVLSRQMVLDKAYKYGSNTKYQNEKSLFHIDRPCRSLSVKSQKKFNKILKDVASECGDSGVSSDECDMEVENVSKSDNHLTTEEYTNMLNMHKRRKISCESHPELDTSSINISDVVMRCHSIKKSVRLKLPKLKKKSPPLSPPVEKNIKTHQPVQLAASETSAIEIKKETPSKIKCKVVPTITGYPKTTSFFSLIGYFFSQEKNMECSLTKMEENIRNWQTHKSSELCVWKMLYPDWCPLVEYAINYMSGKGTSSQLKDFIPLVTRDSNDAHCIWKGTEYKNNDITLPFYNHWLETLNSVMAKEKEVSEPEDKDRTMIDISTRTNYIVCETTEEDKKEFRVQEKERYAKPYNAYIYTTHGYQSIVGPVKGVFSAKDVSGSKAREHALLVPHRPPYVTILCLVRDSVARLPNGEGTRADACMLLKDSQFLNPEATSQQIHGVVSGALDRLHAEKDPCVKFDPARKLWLYLQRTRSIEEFEKLHQASGAAALAKRQMNISKQKAAKLKKLPADVKEALEMQLKKVDEVSKEATELTKKTAPKESNDDGKNDKKKESQQLQRHQLKKKATKRKKVAPPNDVTNQVAKVAKLNTPEVSAYKKKDEFENRSIDNEALMATQSILNDPVDIFNNTTGDVDFLNIDTFSHNLSSLDTSLGSTFDSNMFNDFDESLFSGDKLTPTLPELTQSPNVLTTSTLTALSNTPAKTPPVKIHSQKKSLPHLSDILSEKALSILKPPKYVTMPKHSKPSTNILTSTPKTITITTSVTKATTKHKSQPLLLTQYPTLRTGIGVRYTDPLVKPKQHATQNAVINSQQQLQRRLSIHDVNVSKPNQNIKGHNKTILNIPGIQTSKLIGVRDHPTDVTQKPSLHTLSQFITSKVPSSKSPQTSFQNVAYVKTHLQASTAAPVKSPSVVTSAVVVQPKALNDKTLRTFDIKNSVIPGYQIVNIKGSSGKQIITALPPSSSNARGRIPSTRTPAVTSIQALLQAVQKSIVPKTSTSDCVPKQVQLGGDVKLVQSLVTAPKSVGLPFLSQTGLTSQTDNKSFDSTGKMIITQHLGGQQLLNVQLQKVGGSLVAPVKISLPTTASNSRSSFVNTQGIRYNTSSQGLRHATSYQALSHTLTPQRLRNALTTQALRHTVAPQALRQTYTPQGMRHSMTAQGLRHNIAPQGLPNNLSSQVVHQSTQDMLGQSSVRLLGNNTVQVLHANALEGRLTASIPSTHISTSVQSASAEACNIDINNE